MRVLPMMVAGALGVAASAVDAHHSFAVYFDSSRDVTITGTVTSFRFTNPHGTIALDVTDAQGRVTHWRAETNAPVVLQRRGWARDTIKPGQVVTIDGWPSRDGKPYVRMRRAVDSNGRLIGSAPFGQQDQS